MKIGSLQTRNLNISPSRWLAYSGAATATALAGVSSADGEIHYSGRLDVIFPGDQSTSVAFPLDQAGDSIGFIHSLSFQSSGQAFFTIHGLQTQGFVGVLSSFFSDPYVARLVRSNRYISNHHFLPYNIGTLAGVINHITRGEWQDGGPGFVGFRFNSGVGTQYGWARVKMGDEFQNYRFKVIDYAYADPGERIKPGQINSSGVVIPEEGSLGGLALGAVGVAFWRQRRKCSLV
jgi:hypothetical protein